MDLRGALGTQKLALDLNISLTFCRNKEWLKSNVFKYNMVIFPH